MVEAAEIEPASKGCDQRNLHVLFVHFRFAVHEQINNNNKTKSRLQILKRASSPTDRNIYYGSKIVSKH